MRPQKLELEGFSAFRQPVVVDFAGADLFALVGATGAGKTSVLDAMTFALYGTVPRLDDRRAVAPVVSQNLTEARVRLDFTVGSEAYTAVRVVRATKTGATTKEARLEHGEQVLAGTADEVASAVTDLLGLTFEHFTTCVSLPQGQFARFLHDKPRDRQDLLVRLLDLGLYDRVASVARQRAALAGGRADVLRGQRDRLSAATEAARDAAATRADSLAALLDRMAGAKPALDASTDEARVATEQAERQTQHLAVLDTLEAPPGVDDLSTALAEALAVRTAAAEAEEASSAAAAAAEGALAALPDRAELERRQTDLVRHVELMALVTKGQQAANAVAAQVEAARLAETAAEAERGERANQLERLRVEHRAHALVPELVVGEACPVCRQPVAELPDVALPDLEAVQEALALAERQLKVAGRDLNDARAEQVRVDEKLTGITTELTAVTTRLSAAPPYRHDVPARQVRSAADAAIDRQAVATEAADARGIPDADEDGELAVVAAVLEAVAAAEAGVVEARAGDRAARDRQRMAEREHQTLVARETEARRSFDSARDAVAALEPPAIERRDLASDWAALLAWAEVRRPALVEAVEAQRRRAQQLTRQVQDRLGELTAAAKAAGVECAGGAWPGEAVAAEQARATGQVQRLDEELAEAASLEIQIGQATEERQVADALAGHLAANRFEKWLLDEAVHRLVAGASTILDELTAGAYALAVDGRSGAFTVIDHANASQPRPARTLSGGETFLASLALALALADQVAELAVGGVARLESLFLDEGFGTLDGETLDVVATALDELGARGRMVGVVTHVRELAERLPVRFEVRKVAGTAIIDRIDV